MAALSYSEKFTNVKKYNEDGSYIGLQIASKLNQKNGQDYKLIDAIDIDWNGAWLAVAGAYINNTDELLQAIDDIGDLSDLEWLHDNVEKLNEDVELIFSTYVTQTQLDEILAHYQKPVTGGEHISIDSENVITTYDLLTPGEADAKFTTIESFDALVTMINNDYYNKQQTESVAYNIAIEQIAENVIKNADERYNDLEKISNWITSLPEEILQADDLADRINILEEVVGSVEYNEESDTYTYTGLKETEHDYKLFKTDVNEALIDIRDDIERTSEQAWQAYTTANTAYDMAYTAYTASGQADEIANKAYEMAYHSVEVIGVPHAYGYFTPLTEEQIAILNEDPTAYNVYAIREDNLSGIPLPDYYIPNSELQYYLYTDEVEATGFYKDLDELTTKTYLAQYSADNALFRLYTRTNGTSYARLEIEPFANDGSNKRTIVLDLDEAEINELTGYIGKEGIITTYSLYNAFAYALTPEFITNDDSEEENNDNDDNNG